MTKEQKELLLKDLCARLPYGVKCKYYDCCEGDYDEGTICGFERQEYKQQEYIQIDGVRIPIEEVKPYLFPISNMTKEQYKEWCDLEVEPLDEILTRNADGKKMSTLEHHLLIAKSLTDSINYCYKNHFDIYGLIPMGLANDATNKNIY